MGVWEGRLSPLPSLKVGWKGKWMKMRREGRSTQSPSPSSGFELEGRTPAPLAACGAWAGGHVPPFPSRLRLWLPSYLGSGVEAWKGPELGSWPCHNLWLKQKARGNNKGKSDLCRNERVGAKRASEQGWTGQAGESK